MQSRQSTPRAGRVRIDAARVQLEPLVQEPCTNGFLGSSLAVAHGHANMRTALVIKSSRGMGCAPHVLGRSQNELLRLAVGLEKICRNPRGTKCSGRSE